MGIETKRTIDLLDEECGNQCNVLYSRSFRRLYDNQAPEKECLVAKFIEDKKQTKVRKLGDCEFIYNLRSVLYVDGYSDTFEIGEPVINMKKVKTCTAKYVNRYLFTDYSQFFTNCDLILLNVASPPRMSYRSIASSEKSSI